MWPYPWTHVGTPSHLGHMDRVAATMPSAAHAGAAQEAPDIGQWEGQDVPLVRPSSCNSKEASLAPEDTYLPTWLFGLQSRQGYADYATFWKDDIPPAPCSHCEHRHNTSVHGYVAHCSHAHPLVHAWTSAWPDPSTPTRWRATAHRRDLRIAGRLGVPVSLFRALRTAHGGPEAARKTVYRWQRTVLDSVTAVLSESIPAPSSKPNPFTPSDWNDSH